MCEYDTTAFSFFAIEPSSKKERDPSERVVISKRKNMGEIELVVDRIDDDVCPSPNRSINGTPYDLCFQSVFQSSETWTSLMYIILLSSSNRSGGDLYVLCGFVADDGVGDGVDCTLAE